MSFLRKLFGMKEKSGTGNKTFHEKDNRGTRHDNYNIAASYWLTRVSSPKKDPFVLYEFDEEQKAREAILELPCVHVAADTGNLICTEVLAFGCYRNEAGKYESVVCGDDLTHELWQMALSSFMKHGGRPKGQGSLEPERRSAPKKVQASAAGGKVVFVREDRTQRMGQTMTYRIHKGPDAASAKAFLDQNPVTRNFLYIIVETPEGNYCRDIQGIYKE